MSGRAARGAGGPCVGPQRAGPAVGTFPWTCPRPAAPAGPRADVWGWGVLACGPCWPAPQPRAVQELRRVCGARSSVRTSSRELCVGTQWESGGACSLGSREALGASRPSSDRALGSRGRSLRCRRPGLSWCRAITRAAWWLSLRVDELCASPEPRASSGEWRGS